ncbi:MAG: DUF2935 domain-containing protein [Lachnospiraceae bacterium]|nr:DUF2935 domain-containing protein [Lachnospiraceae bacterium]
MNQRALRLLDELIAFKEALLREVSACRLFNANYPLLIQHILREAKRQITISVFWEVKDDNNQNKSAGLFFTCSAVFCRMKVEIGKGETKWTSMI